uniref:Uncharacterized protein n=1 Tax=Astyanax mexicanus TaxID=7994 RepID=A0A3B1ID37_ASTMX
RVSPGGTPSSGRAVNAGSAGRGAGAERSGAETHKPLSTLLVSYITFVKLFAEYLNEVAAMNWRQVIFKFQYFDSKGMFISLVYSVPLLFNSIIIVAVWVKRTFSTMTELKTLQLKRKAADKMLRNPNSWRLVWRY